MSTTPVDGYKLFQKLHPLSLLAQLSSRHATGCLRVFTKSNSWSIYLEEGKLTYASCSDNLFERLDTRLRQLNQHIPTLNSSARIQMRMKFETKDESVSQPDYQAICWLVDGDYITYPQAATLVNELAKEVLESFLTIQEGSYEFRNENPLEDLPTFCHLDLRSLVENAQKELRSRRINQQKATSGEHSSIVKEINPANIQVKPNEDVEKQLKKPTKNEIVKDNKDNKNTNISNSTKERLYTVACIDDSLTILKSIKRFLDEDNFSVVMINDPVKALMQILRSKPDLILLDVEMPNLDGYELCSLLRRHSAFKNIPIIMVTGRTGFVDRAKAKMVRASGYLTKPFTQSELLKIVFKHIS
ncbi:MAG: response regulator [Rivularia sp. T60_A2020_040]|nr:response regulator [Rivularia sp. T60_A2020_040]